MAEPELLSTDEVARRLGVRRETVYAYVSRGLLERHGASSRRRSLFDRAAVERLAGRARRTDRSGALEVVVDTELTLLDPAGRLYYRGHDAIELARHRTFEQVASLLWAGDAHAPWELSGHAAHVVAGLSTALPAAAGPVERIAVAVAGLAAATGPKPPGPQTDPDAVRTAAATILAGALDVLPAASPAADRSAAARLWTALALAPGRPRPGQLAALDAALVLLADHELPASTFAARIAASAHADPYRVVLTGLGPLAGALHGGAGGAVENLLAEIPEPGQAAGVLARARARTAHVPGFGHRVYRDGDPRADHLLTRVEAAACDPDRARIVAALLGAAAAQGLPAPNADLALGALAYVLELRPGAAPAVFTVARLAGMLAHALEEYPHRLRFRPRASYIGPRPRP